MGRRKTNARIERESASRIAPPAKQSQSLNGYVTTKQAAELMGVGQRHILHLITVGKVKGIKLGHDWVVYKPSLSKYHETKSARGRPAQGSPKFQGSDA